ncbi:hypothetical protein L195_g023479 [Trifolium pratense]|uniref:Uncharacterized protein n=1 Tax=Trifolium pratense TaxID=57577 RepID=A0A2K3NB01_TRIPR|nr:hypothetical protein L195_g023479 [Trifolium pratense]
MSVFTVAEKRWVFTAAERQHGGRQRDSEGRWVSYIYEMNRLNGDYLKWREPELYL